MPDFTPAPLCTTTSAPSALIFFTVSGVAATRGSGSVSAGIATFMRPPRRPSSRNGPAGSDEEISHPEQEDDQEADDPFRHRQKQVIGALVLGVVVPVRRCVLDLAVVDHVSALQSKLVRHRD